MKKYDFCSKCEKCGFDQADTRYDEMFDRMVRTCLRCSARRYEYPLNSEEVSDD